MIDKIEYYQILNNSIEQHSMYSAFRPCTFYFSIPEYDSSKFLSDENLKIIVDIFKSNGYEISPYDTIYEYFNLNQDFEVVHVDKAIREYGFTLPVFDNIDDMITILDLVWSGKIICLVNFKYSNDLEEK